MIAFLIRRTAHWFLLALLLTFVTFVLSSAVPGDFFSTHLLDPGIRPKTVDQLRHQYGLDQPVFLQYIRWLVKAITLDFGFSLFYQRPVAPVVADALTKTLWLGVPALTFGLIGGVLLGTLHGTLSNPTLRVLFGLLSTAVLSLPSLVLGLAALLFAAHTGWFPLGSMGATNLLDQSIWAQLTDRIHHLVLPVCCLTLPILASVERVQYAAVQGCRTELYLRSARSRGLTKGHIFFHYLLRPGLNPVLSISGPMLGGVLSGSLVLEMIFAWPGLGQITYDALFNNDLFLLTGCILGASLLLVTGNLLADLLLLVLDPRTVPFGRRGLR